MVQMWSGVWPGAWSTRKGTPRNSAVPSSGPTVSSARHTMPPQSSIRPSRDREAYTCLHMRGVEAMTASPSGRQMRVP